MSDPVAFSANVGSAHGENWLHWLADLIGKPGVMGLELGTWKGESAEWWFTHVLTHPTSALCCIDTFEGSPEHALAGIDCSGIENEARDRLKPFGDRVMILKGQTHKTISFAGMWGPFDFIYVDAAHDAMDVLRDAVLAFELLKVGGVMIFDDYEWRCMEAEVDRPKIAIDGFLACYARQIEVIGMGWQVAVRKVAP